MKNLLLFILLIASNSIFAQQTIVTSEKKKQILEYIRHFDDNQQLMGNISIFENGKEVVNKTFGAKNTTSTKYTVGSITKMFTAVMIHQLAESDEIDLDDKLKKYFRKIPNSKKITIRQMLNHTSGLGDYVVIEDSIYNWLNKPVERKDIIQEIIRQGVEFQPGEGLRYSNSAYYLLARILEKEYKKSFEQIIEEQIIVPLQLKNSFAIDDKTPLAHLPKSFELEKEEWIEVEEFYFLNASGAGNLVSNGHDLNQFLVALFSDKLISQESLKQMLPKNDDLFGAGIMKIPFPKCTAYGHGGDTYGTHSLTSIDPENKISVALSMNGGDYPTNQFAVGILSIIYDMEFELPNFEEYTPNKEFYATYEGTYASDDLPISIKIFVEGDELNAQGEGQPAFELTPRDEHVFDFQKAGVKIIFEPNENKLILEQSGQSYEMTKEK